MEVFDTLAASVEHRSLVRAMEQRMRQIRLTFLMALSLLLNAVAVAQTLGSIEQSTREVALKPAAGKGGEVEANVSLKVAPRGPRVVLYVHARHETCNLPIRVLDGAGKLLAEDDDSGGGTIPWVKVDFDKATDIEIIVLASGLEKATTCTLHLAQVQETAKTLAALEKVRPQLAAADEAAEKGQRDESREIVGALLEQLLALPELDQSATGAELLFEAAERASKTGWLLQGCTIRQQIVAFYERVMPAEHRQLVLAVQALASNLAHLGKIEDARVLFERVLEVRERIYAPEHKAVLGAKVNLAIAFRHTGKLKEARALEEEVLEIQERLLPGDDPELQLTRMNLAQTLDSLGDLQGSLELLEKVLKVQEDSLPDDDPALQLTRQNIGIAYFKMGRIESARDYLRQCLEVHEQSLPDEHPLLISVRANYALVLASLGDYRGALEIERKVLEVRERTLPKDSPAIIRARLNLAARLQDLGEMQEAVAIEASTLAIQERTLREDDPELLLSKSNYCATLLKLGDFQKVRSILEHVLKTAERVLPPNHLDLQGIRFTYAKLLEAIGDLGGAKELLEKCISVMEGSVVEHQSLLQSMRQVHGSVLLQLGDILGARATFERNLEILEQVLPADHSNLQDARTALAAALQRSGDLDGARLLHKQVLEAREHSLPADHTTLQIARMNYASVLQMMGDLASARAVLTPAVEVLQRSRPGTDPTLLDARNNMAGILTLMGEMAAARDIYAELFEIKERLLPSGHPSLRDARHNLACVLVCLGETGAPFVALLDGMVNDLLHQQTSFLPQLSLRQTGTMAGDINLDINTLLQFSAFAMKEAQSELDQRILAAIETTRCAESAARRLARLAPKPGSELALKADSLRLAARQANDAISRFAAEPEAQQALREAILEKEKAEKELAKLLGKQPGASQLLMATTASALGQVLQPGEAAVSYWTFDQRDWKIGKVKGAVREPGELERIYVAFVVRHDGTVTRVDLGAAEKLDSRVKAWRTLIRQGMSENDKALKTQAEALRVALIDPVLEAAGEVNRLYAALDETVHLVPLDSLPQGGEKNGLVGDSVEIHVVTALRDLLLIEGEPEPAPPSLLAAGAIDYQAVGSTDRSGRDTALLQDGAPRDVLSGESFEPLPASGDEVKTVADIYTKAFKAAPPATVLTGEDATRGAFLEHASATRYLHLATHAWFAPDEIPSTADRTRASAPVREFTQTLEETVRGYAPMLLCGVALTGAGAGRVAAVNTGILTAQEISGLDLSGCELAVLSACETSLGSRRPGQGVASLQQSLHAAGVRLSLTSLWKVPDTTTQMLMDEFYRRLWVDKETPQRALWEAKRTLREAKDKSERNRFTPRDWAGWVLSGVSRRESR